MKRLTPLVFFVVTVFTASAQKAVPSREAIQKFHNLFPRASNVHWSSKARVNGVAFTHNENSCVAYFAPDGDLIARGRRISTNQLPIFVQDGFSKAQKVHEDRFGELTTRSVYEFATASGTKYLAFMENNSASLLFRSDGERVRVSKMHDKPEENPGKALLAQLD